MQKIVRLYKILVLVIGVYLWPQLSIAQNSNFFSLHQMPKSVAVSLGSDGQYVYSPALQGFQLQYEPRGVTGCGVGISSLSSQCLIGNGLSAFVPGYSGYREIKAYIPAGTLTFAVSGFIAQGLQFAVAARIGQPPSRSQGVPSGEYEQLKTQSPNLAFNKLLAGQEVVLVHDGGGSIILSGNGVLQRWPTVKGAWLYMRVLNGDELYNFQYQNKIDGDEYTDWYSGFLTSGGFDSFTKDPKEIAYLPEPPVGIKLLSSILKPNESTKVRPVNESAMVLGECTLKSRDSNAPVMGVTIKNYTITAASNVPDQSLIVACGNAADFSSIYAPLTAVFTAELRVCGTCGDVPLADILLSSNQLIITNNPVPIVISPVPESASLGSCQVSDPSKLTVSTNTISLTDNGVNLSAATTVTITCSGKSKVITIQPGLSLSPDTLTLSSLTSKSTVSAVGLSSLSCVLTGANGFDPSRYLEWNPPNVYSLKTNAPPLDVDQSITVTCSDRSAVLHLKKAPPGLLYPVHNDEVNIGETRAPKDVLLRWRRVDGSGNLVSLPLFGNFPGYPVSGDGTVFKCEDSKNVFDFTSVADTSKGRLKDGLALTAPVTTKINCYSASVATAAQITSSLKSTASLQVNTDNTWELTQATAANPIVELTDVADSPVKLQIYIPKASDNSKVDVVLMGYVPLMPVFPWDDNLQAEVFLLNPVNPYWIEWLDRSTEASIVYTSVLNSAVNRVLDVSLLFPKSALADIKAKIAVFYTTSVKNNSWVRMTKEWDSSQ